jgi:glutathione synthase/RimK-type ligase-like ATP-grasp enzyme
LRPVKILSAADDYRYSAEPTKMLACELPGEVAARCRKVARAMKLSVAGLDCKRTRDGSWYCFEVNPSPGFTYFEKATGQPIADSIAQLLMSGRPGH